MMGDPASGTLVATGEINVRKNFVALLLLGGLTGAACAQQPAPPLLLHAATCLASKKQLPTSPGTALSLGSWTDAKSYPGKKVLYVVATSGTNHSAGRMYSIFYRIGTITRFSTFKTAPPSSNRPMGRAPSTLSCRL
jgi:hypothetical protein